ncbi:MAG: energy-coupling factor ABC transporter permease [Deltaproteobacteria bacterium]|nr:energy-coupling factor ABC transporter permease [Deltaproteobacteria bacterium]
MHIPDGFLSPVVSIPALAAATPVWIYAARKHFGPSAVESLPVMGSVTALAFVIQTIMIPVPGGTSIHLLGVTLLALRYNPLVAFVCESLVLLMQATFFGAGGFTVLGVNALAMGLLGPGAAWLVHRLLGRLSAALQKYGDVLRRGTRGGESGRGERSAPLSGGPAGGASALPPCKAEGPSREVAPAVDTSLNLRRAPLDTSLNLRRAPLSQKAATFAAAYVAMQVSALSISLVLGLQHALSERYFPVPLPVTLAAMMVPSLVVAGPLEGAYTVLALALLRRSKVHGFS